MTLRLLRRHRFSRPILAAASLLLPLAAAFAPVPSWGAATEPSPSPAATAFVPEAIAGPLLRHYMDRVPAPALAAGLTLDEAYAVQEVFVRGLETQWMAFVPDLEEWAGYKAALTNPAVQEKFGVNAPVHGVLLKGMLRDSGTTVEAKFGCVPLHEGDVLVRVRSAAINEARTHAEVLAALDAVIPFIELPDLVFGKEVAVDGPAIVAINAGARLGVVGKPIPLSAGVDWEKRLAEFTVDVLDEKGRILASGVGRDLLGHPLDVVLWLRDSLKLAGYKLDPGEVLSLGTITKLLPAQPGTTIRARYSGLDPRGPVEVSVNFAGQTLEKGRP